MDPAWAVPRSDLHRAYETTHATDKRPRAPMVGTTLREIRTAIEQHASDDGDYYIVCARTGDRPVPVADKRFPTRAAAIEAAEATEQYRATLRRYDPQVPVYDPIVCQASEERSAQPQEPPSSDTLENRSPVSDRSQPLIGFCHDVSGAVFEALSQRGHAAVERAIMETYLDAAESVPDRNALCLELLERTATELEHRLAADERVSVLQTAAAKLSPVQPAVDPVEACLEHLRSISFVSDYGVARRSADATRGTDTAWVVFLRGYAIDGSDRLFPTLPIGVELLRRTATAKPSVSLGVSDATALGDGDWRLVLTTDAAANGLVCTRAGPGE